MSLCGPCPRSTPAVSAPAEVGSQRRERTRPHPACRWRMGLPPLRRARRRLERIVPARTAFATEMIPSTCPLERTADPEATLHGVTRKPPGTRKPKKPKKPKKVKIRRLGR